MDIVQRSALKTKKKQIFITPKGYFMHVKCNSCETLTRCYSHSTTERICDSCASLILKPSGGKAILMNNSTFKRIN